MLTKLQELITENGNCVNLGRHLQAAYPEIYQKIMDATSFLDVKQKIKFNERVYCAINNITTIVLNKDDITHSRFVNLFSGYCCLKEPTPAVYERTMDDVREESVLVDLTYAALIGSHDATRGNKIRRHCISCKSRNRALYSDALVAGKDYIMCPITGLRKACIRKNYTLNILGLSMDEYLDIVGKDFVMICTAHKTKISDGLKVIDEETGKTKHQGAVIATQITLNTVDPLTGKTGHNKRTAKTVNTHLTTIDENGLNGFQRIAATAIIKGNATKRKRGIIVAEEDKSDFKHYKNLVHWLTKHNSGHLDTSKSGLAGTPGATHIDHMYSIFKGFAAHVSPIVIGSRHNLEILSWEENTEKHDKCSIDLTDLLDSAGYTLLQSEQEFNDIMHIVNTEFDAQVSAALLFEKYNERTNILR